ncbi:phytanoyl-CoA dioxygenase family protein [Nostoc sp. FACHB-145]|uniref:phytanoyl-CoA dioxygenase family protein n=1 Tax=Nostoc sp. FACHB-145 TaxID=2692836 RepID=UPI0016871E59|nr:phytanoyl-CoA dioxygenase family protein [Nostoc sp. FACHB-145]MBD2472393.1 phytanoyl-CoA dioxygenase family protein [Nostoc sp. FACHB-145]
MEAVASLVNEIINGKGYVVIPEVLSAAQAETARSTVLKLAQQERERGQVMSEGQRERVHGLVYKGEIFELMVQHPTVIKIIEAIVGADMTLGGFSAHILHPGATNMGVHVDYPYWAMKPPFPAYPVLEVQAIWMVEDFTESNGAPVFSPGSQKFCNLPDLTHFSKTAEKITGKAGSLVLSHGLCWHDTSINSTQKPRVSILGNYNPKFVRPLEDLFQSLQQEVVDRATPKLRQLLGYEFKASLFKDIQRLYELNNFK